MIKNKLKKIFFLALLFFPSMAFAQRKTTLTNPLGNRSPETIVGDAISYILGFIGVIALVVFIVGGITWMTSMGNPDKVKKGKDTLVWGALGILVIFGSYAIIHFIFSIVGA